MLTILGDRLSLYLYGSAATGDYRHGWSDIDILCLTEAPVSPEQADALLYLRQTLLAREPGNAYFRRFEGAFASLDEFAAGAYSRVVYWGTSGQRIAQAYRFDAFSTDEWLRGGILLHGEDVRAAFSPPSFAQLRQGVIDHAQTIRRYAVQTNESLYSCGWLLDIARGLYTLRVGRVIPKTAAGEWALKEGLCPVPDALMKTLAVRKNPLRYKDDPETLAWLSTLGPAVQRFADVLEAEIERAEQA